MTDALIRFPDSPRRRETRRSPSKKGVSTLNCTQLFLTKVLSPRYAIYWSPISKSTTVDWFIVESLYMRVGEGKEEGRKEYKKRGKGWEKTRKIHQDDALERHEKEIAGSIQ